MATFKIANVIAKSLFKKPATLMYPVVPREWQERTRGHVEIDVTSCIVCGICAKKCPADAIVVDRASRTWEIQRMQCIQCNSCVDTCPKKCLTMAPEYTQPDTQKVVDTFEIPEVKKEAPAASASAGGALKCDLDTCIYCGICAKNCPCNAITVERKPDKSWTLDSAACVQCGVCVDKCPKKCLVIE